ncbi:ABC transporter ATP-binding protein [Labrys sp. WJW]|uniref:ABC transporter ATP-binding protein n=1 Tax=Labrys sp. WJW TaxID=1737983 RepID=UPI000A436239|nr:ABC transporter ATP-binding protein [Labrys sp. WJW]
MATALELKQIDKRFGPVHANKAIDLVVERGTIHGIIGENGAGKSTLMSIIYGFYEADSGEIHVNGAVKAIRSSQDAIDAGIGMVHQHFMLVDPFTVLENVMLGAEGGGLLAKGREHARTELARLEKSYHLEVDPDAVVGELPVGAQQRVEILKALYRGADILILDEPTGVLTPSEADQLFEILKVLREQGKTILLITHKLREIMAITDRVSVMRRGEMVATVDTAKTNPTELAELMVGRRVLLRVDKAEAKPGDVILEVKNLTVKDEKGIIRVDDVSFTVRTGEIVGVAGVAGNGQSELLEAIAGIRPVFSGEIRLRGSNAAAADPAELRKLGLAHVPEDRMKMGLVKPFAAYESAILGYQKDRKLGSGPFLNYRRIIADLTDKMERFDVRPRDPKLKTANFSGGNAQKIVLAREMERDPALLIVGQPTRGVDIGAIEFIHRRLIGMRDAGKGILVVSVELDEIMGLSDRILVMCGGRVTGECLAKDATENGLGLLMAGVSGEAA